MEKILFVATVESHIIRFHTPYLKYFKEKGYEVHVACNGDAEIPYCDVKHKIEFERFPFKMANIKAYKMLKKIMKENNFKLIHCHTPVGGAVGRLSAISSRKKGTKVFYTAHGFHFCQGGPKKDWLVFYPVEKFLSKYTDCLITINLEDFALAYSKFNAKDLHRIDGVGVDIEKFSKTFTTQKKEKVRKELELRNEDFVLLYVADLSDRKNQGFIINLIPRLKRKIPNIKVLFAGPDTFNKKHHKHTEKLGVENYINFLNERNDIVRLLQIADISLTSSKREGLAVNVIEAMAAGRCVVASAVRGNQDLIIENKTGFLYTLENENQFMDLIFELSKDYKKIESVGEAAKESVHKYSIEAVLLEMIKIYEKHLD